jgi:hypothetical protein
MDFFARSYSILGAREAFVVREVHVDLSISFSLQENTTTNKDPTKCKLFQGQSPSRIEV